MSIPLHPDRGLDPHLTYCPRCHNETQEIIVGDNRKLTNNRTGQVALCPRDKVTKTMRELGWHPSDVDKLEVEPNERLPASDLCDTCKDELTEFGKIVAAGGVHWRCADCHREGVIHKSAFAEAVREANKTPAPDPCGVEFPACEEHGEIG